MLAVNVVENIEEVVVIDEVLTVGDGREEVGEIIKGLRKHYNSLLFGYVIDMRCQGRLCLSPAKNWDQLIISF